MKLPNRHSPFSELLRHSSHYFISNLATGAIIFLSVPVMTRLLSVSDYGIFSVFMGYQGVFVALLTLNCYVAMGRYFYERKTDFKFFFGTNLIFVLFLLLISFFFSILFREKTAGLLSLPLNTIIYIVPIVLIYVLGSWFEQIYIPQKESRKIAVRNILRALSIFALSIFIILVMDNDKYLGQIYAMMVVGSIFSIYYFFDLKSYLAFSFQWKHMNYILNYSLPLLPYALSGVVLAQFDRIMINYYLGSAHAGLYSFAAIIGSILTVLSSALFQAWHPDYFRHMDTQNYGALKSDISKILNIIIVFSFFLILFSKEIGTILGAREYHAALPVIPIIIIGYIFNTIFAFYGWNIEYKKKNIYLSIAVLVAGFINIVLNMIFIPRFGYFAAAYTTTISYFFMAFLVWITCKFILKIYCVPLRIIFKPIALITPAIAIYYLITSIGLHFPILFISKILLCAAVITVIYRNEINAFLIHKRV